MVRVCASPSQFGNDGRHDLVGDGSLRLVDRIAAEHRQAAPHDPCVFLRRAGQAVVGRDLWHVAGDMDLGKTAVGGEDQNAFWRLAERKRLFAVGRGDLGDDKIPAADGLVFRGSAPVARRRRRPTRASASMAAAMVFGFMVSSPGMMVARRLSGNASPARYGSPSGRPGRRPAMLPSGRPAGGAARTRPHLSSASRRRGDGGISRLPSYR